MTNGKPTSWLADRSERDALIAEAKQRLESASDAGTSGCSGCEETRKRLDALEEQLAELRRKVRFMDAHIPYRIG